jgi:hypothetical protein
MRISDIELEAPLSIGENEDTKGPMCHSKEIKATHLTKDCAPECDFSSGLQPGDLPICFEGSGPDLNEKCSREDTQTLTHVLPNMRVALKEASA